MTAIGFIVRGRPLTWQRPPKAGSRRFDKRGKAAEAYAAVVRGHAVQALQGAKLAGVAWPDVTSHKPVFRVDVAGWWPDRHEGDEDRLLSLVYDALQGVAYKSDRQVKATSLALGLVGDEPQIAVMVEVIDREDAAIAANVIAINALAEQAKHTPKPKGRRAATKPAREAESDAVAVGLTLTREELGA